MDPTQPFEYKVVSSAGRLYAVGPTDRYRRLSLLQSLFMAVTGRISDKVIAQVKPTAMDDLRQALHQARNTPGVLNMYWDGLSTTVNQYPLLRPTVLVAHMPGSKGFGPALKKTEQGHDTLYRRVRVYFQKVKREHAGMVSGDQSPFLPIDFVFELQNTDKDPYELESMYGDTVRHMLEPHMRELVETFLAQAGLSCSAVRDIEVSRLEYDPQVPKETVE